MLPKSRRLIEKRDFDRVFGEGRTCQFPAVRVAVATGQGRYGIVASKAFGCVARRNTIRRRWREALGQLAAELPLNLDAVFVVKAAAGSLRGDAVREALRGALAAIEKS